MQGIRWIPLIAISVMLVGCASAGKSATPPEPPQRVVAAYFAALNAHDKAQARPLVTPGFANYSFNPRDGWFNSRLKITQLETTRPRYTHSRYGSIAHVRTRLVVEFPLKQAPTQISGQYCLERKNVGDPWRIEAQGDC